MTHSTKPKRAAATECVPPLTFEHIPALRGTTVPRLRCARGVGTRPSSPLSPDLGERLVDVSDDVVLIFEADGDPDQGRWDSSLLELLRAHPGMGR